MKTTHLLVASLLCSPPVLAQAPEEPDLPKVRDISELSLDELLDTQVVVASRKALTARESPGVVTVVTRQEIQETGASDLAEVLELVPGVALALDTQGMLGLGFRGNWGHEGKVLLLFDGQEMNETLYSTLQFGNHYPVDNIERVEFMRGPGSAVHGGFAELAVVNVITRGPDEYRGVSAALTFSQGQRDFARMNLSATVNQHLDALGGVDLSAFALVGQGSRSEQSFTDFAGMSYDLRGASALDPMFFNLGARTGGLSLRFVYDGYRTTVQDGFGEVLPEPVEQTFPGVFAEARYDLQLAPGLTLTPRISFKQQSAWRVADETSDLFYDKTAQRTLAGLALSFDATEDLNFLLGGEGFLDRAKLNSLNLTGLQAPFGEEEEATVAYRTLAAYAQLLWHTQVVNVTAGARYESHNAVDPSFVPRLALTRVFGRVHLKALASAAFRAPGIENLNLGLGVKPERTTVYEGEVGYQLSDHFFLGLNAYDITIKQPIVYFVDPSLDGVEGYQNFEAAGTRGVEAELKMRFPRAWATVAYSFYTAADKPKVPLNEVEGDEAMLLAFATHKLAFKGSWALTPKLSANLSGFWLGSRHGLLSGDDEGEGVQGATEPATVLNLFVAYKDLGVKGIELGVGGYNLLGTSFQYLQPYRGGHAPLPALDREFGLRLSYNLPQDG